MNNHAIIQSYNILPFTKATQALTDMVQKGRASRKKKIAFSFTSIRSKIPTPFRWPRIGNTYKVSYEMEIIFY